MVLQFLPDALGKYIRVILLLPRVVEVRVPVEHTGPGAVDFVDVAEHLLSHVDEVFPCQGVVLHNNAACLTVHLIREVGRLVAQVIQLPRFFRQHKSESFFGVVGDSDRFLNFI